MNKFISIKGMNCADKINTYLLVNISHIVVVDVRARAFSTTEAENSSYVVSEESMPTLLNALGIDLQYGN